MIAVKGNRQYTIVESEIGRFYDDGFDIKDDKGVIIKHGKGKTIPYTKYMELEAENKALKAEIAALKAPAKAKDDQKEPPKKG